MKRVSEAFDSARSEYIEGYVEKNKIIFPTLALVAKEFNVSFSTLRKKLPMKAGSKKESIIKILEKNLKYVNNSKVSIPSLHKFHGTLLSLLNIFKMPLMKK